MVNVSKKQIRDFLKEYGKNFRLLRTRKKLSQLRVAQFVGVSQAIISHIECGYFLPSPELESTLIDLYKQNG